MKRARHVGRARLLHWSYSSRELPWPTRWTFVLFRQGRYQEVIDEVVDYFRRYPDTVTPNHAVFRRKTDAEAILNGTKQPRKPPAAAKLKGGKVSEAELAPILEKARKDRAPYDWLMAARLCRKAGDMERERDLLEEYLGGPRVRGRSWLELEERLYKVRAMLGALG